MRGKTFIEALKKLCHATGDYTDITTEQLLEEADELRDWESFLRERVREIWEDFDWNELCDIYEITVQHDKNFAFFTIPNDTIFYTAFAVDPRQTDIIPGIFEIRQFGEKFKIMYAFPQVVFARLQKACPELDLRSDEIIPDYIVNAAVQLAFADVMKGNGHIQKAQVLESQGNGIRDREMAKQTRTRQKTIGVRR